MLRTSGLQVLSTKLGVQKITVQLLRSNYIHNVNTNPSTEVSISGPRPPGGGDLRLSVAMEKLPCRHNINGLSKPI